MRGSIEVTSTKRNIRADNPSGNSVSPLQNVPSCLSKMALFLVLLFSCHFFFFQSFDTRLLRVNKYHRSFSRGQSNTYDFDMVRPSIEFSLSETQLVSSFMENYDEGAKIQGVYAVQDVSGTVLYVGSSMSMPVDIGRLSRKLGADTVHSLRIQTFPNPKQDAIEAYKLELIRQLSPSGNLDNFELWEDRAVIRNAPADPVKEEVEESGRNSKIADSRERLAEAVGVDSTSAPAPTIESPFTDEPSDSYIIGPSSTPGIPFTKENVDKVLDEVRPYLIADGGNVEVVSVDEFTRSVSLTLQGACGSCPSSTTTMKMGIERVLKENFPNLGPVLQVVPVVGLSVSEVEKALEKVLPAIKSMGGSVSIGSVDSETGEVIMRFRGPARLKVGIQLVVKDVALVKKVTIVDMADDEASPSTE